MVHDDSHSALRLRAVRVSRRAESTGMAMLRKIRRIIPLAGAPDFSIFRVTPADISIPYQYSATKYRFYPNVRARRHRSQDPLLSPERQPDDHAGACRQGRALGLALPS